MRYEDLFIGVLIIILLIIAAVRILAPKPMPTRALLRDSHGKLTGSGSLTSAPLELTAGSYRIDYQFDALTRLALVDANGDETLFIRRDAGTEPLEILETGRYRFLVEPTGERAAWAIVYRQIR